MCVLYVTCRNIFSLNLFRKSSIFILFFNNTSGIFHGSIGNTGFTNSFLGEIIDTSNKQSTDKRQASDKLFQL